MQKPPNPASIFELVARYEAMVDNGDPIFLDETSYSQLVYHYEQEAQFDRALEVVDLALSHFAFSIDFHLKKAELLLDQGLSDESLQMLDRASALAPGEPEVELLRAEVFIDLSAFDSARDILDELKPGASGTLLSHILTVEGIMYEAQGLYEQMYYVLDTALREDPSNTDAIEYLWVSLEACKKYREGLEILEHVLDYDPYISQAWFYLGHIRAYFVDYDEAINCYEYAFLSDPRFEAAYRECAELCLENKLFHKALGIYEEVFELFEPDSDLLLRLGQCHQALGRVKVARSFYMQVLTHDPLDDEVLFHIGLCHALEGQWNKAIRYYKRAIQIEEGREEFYDALAFAYQQVGKIDVARAYYEQAVATAPEQGLYWAHFACFLLETGQGMEAIDLLDEAEDIATGHELTYCRIGCLFQLGRRQEGLYRLGEALTEYYEQHQTLFDMMPGLANDSDITSMISAYYST